jgi:hypothetical protein
MGGYADVEDALADFQTFAGVRPSRLARSSIAGPESSTTVPAVEAETEISPWGCFWAARAVRLGRRGGGLSPVCIANRSLSVSDAPK